MKFLKKKTQGWTHTKYGKGNEIIRSTGTICATGQAKDYIMDYKTFQ